MPGRKKDKKEYKPKGYNLDAIIANAEKYGFRKFDTTIFHAEDRRRYFRSCFISR